MMLKNVRQLCVLLSLVGLPVMAQQTDDNEKFNTWKKQFIEKASRQGIDATPLKEVDSPNPKIIKLDRNQLHATIRFETYLQRVAPQSRLNTAKQRYLQHEELLKQVGKKYGVQPRFIVALWAVESDFGRRMGDFSVLRSLATLAYDGRREKFFTDELMNALKILNEGHITNDRFLGSWAGAMGQCQFMPSSFLAYAQDFNGDGRKDIWGTVDDVFASAANYLSQSGWNDAETWGREVSNVPADIEHGTEKALLQWSARGVLTADGKALPNLQRMATLIRPKRSDKTYLVYKNYHVIKKWNNSDYFALSVSSIADSLRADSVRK